MPQTAIADSDLETSSRALSALEKMFWYADQGHPNHFCIVGEVRGRTDVGRWRRAVTEVVAQSPLAQSRFRCDPGGEPILSMGATQPVHLEVFRGDSGAWRRVVGLELGKPIDAARGPLVRSTLIFEPDRATLILTAHHAIADGLGLTFMLRDILSLVGGEPVLRSGETRSAEMLVAETLGALPEAAPGQAPTPVPFRTVDGSMPEVCSASLAPKILEQLRNRCRSEETTVHSLLAAALTAAAAELRPRRDAGPTRILSPLDLRKRLLGSTEHLGLCVVGAVTELDSPGEDLWRSARAVSAALAASKTPEGLISILAIVQMMEPLLTSVDQARSILASAFGCDILLTNLGDLGFPQTIGALDLEAVWGPSVSMGFSGEQTVGVATHSGRLNLVHTSYAPIVGLLPETVRLLTAAV